MRQHGAVKNSQQAATLKIIWCLFCHVDRQEPCYAAEAAACRGINVRKSGIAYYALSRMHRLGFVERTAEPAGVSPGPPKQFYTPSQGPKGELIVEVAARIPMPEDCVERRLDSE